MSQHPQSYSQTLVTLSQMLIFLILTGVDLYPHGFCH